MNFKTIFRKYYKYFLTLFAFLLLMLFFDQNDWITMHKRSRELKDKTDQIDYMTKEIDSMQSILDDVQSDKNHSVERYARQNFGEHRDSEDVYMIMRPVAPDTLPAK